MIRNKMTITLLCILLIGHHVHAVVNKAASQTSANKDEEKKKEIKADDRISNSYGSPSSDGQGGVELTFGKPASIYGPPDFASDNGPASILPISSSQLTLPSFGSSLPPFGPPLNGHGPSLNGHGPSLNGHGPSLNGHGPSLNGHGPSLNGHGPSLNGHGSSLNGHGPSLNGHGPSLNGFGLLLNDHGPSLNGHGPSLNGHGPSLNGHGPPPPGFGPPLSPFPSKVNIGISNIPLGPPPKQHLGPPRTFVFGPPKRPFGPPPPNHHGPPKSGHGPPIPISLNTYGPPPPPPPSKINVHFNNGLNGGHGGPSLPLSVPSFHGGNIHGPPPPGPPPGVASPPTPPDIKYDGWQPIVGLTNYPSKNSNGQSNSNVPSDSYGIPIHNPEAQHLKMSVNDGSSSNGLPPPPLPQYEPLHNDVQTPPKVHGPQVFDPSQHSTGGQYDVPNVQPLSIIKTVGVELLPGPSGAGPDTQGLSVSHDTSSQNNQLPGSFNINLGPSLPGLDLGAQNGGSHGLSGGNDVGNGFQNVGNDIGLTQLQVQVPGTGYGSPLPSINVGSDNAILPGLSLPPPPPFDTYSAPPLSSYSPNGPYPASQSGRASSAFSPFGLQGSSFPRPGPFHPRHHGSFRPPPPPPPFGALTPPRSRDAIKFRDAVPPGLLTSLHRQIPAKFPRPFITPPSFGQQLPNLNVPVAFNQPSGPTNGLPASLGSFGNLNSPMAAPNVQYGTPLSFVDFNTPAPVLTYGAPNFGPATSFGSTSTGFGNNLYTNVGNTLMTYGTPVVNAGLTTGSGSDCGFQQSTGSGSLNIESGGGHGQNLGATGPSFPLTLPASQPAPAEVDHHTLFNTAVSNSLGGTQVAPSVNHFGLEDYEQQKTNLKDSYGNPIGIAYDVHDQTSNALSTDRNHSPSGQDASSGPSVPPSGPPTKILLSSAQFPSGPGPSAEALTANHPTQGFPEPKSLGAANINAGHFLKTQNLGGNDIDGGNFLKTQNLGGNDVNGGHYLKTQNLGGNDNTGSYFLKTQNLGGNGVNGGHFLKAQNLGENDIDAGHFLKTQEGSQALSLAQGLTAGGSDGFHIQGSKGTYMLQIQPADGGLGTENSDGNVRHEQVLSNGLLQDILAAIEQPDQGRIQLQGLPQGQPLQEVYDDPPRPANLPILNGHFITVDGGNPSSGFHGLNVHATDRSETQPHKESPISTKTGPIALFFNNQHGDTRKETRSVSKDESQPTVSAEEKTDVGKSKEA